MGLIKEGRDKRGKKKNVNKKQTRLNGYKNSLQNTKNRPNFKATN